MEPVANITSPGKLVYWPLVISMAVCGGCSSGGGEWIAAPTTPPVTPPPVDPGTDPTIVDGLALRGVVTGLATNKTVTLQEVGTARTVAVSSNGNFNFADPFTNATNYSVVVLNQPVGQNCAVSNSSGTLAGVDVTNISVVCLGSSGYNLDLLGFAIQDPSVVVAGVRVEDFNNGASVTNLLTTNFSVRENGQAVDPAESFLTAEQIADESVIVKTVLLLDISTSIDTEEMGFIKTAAKQSLYSENDEGVKTSKLFEDRQQVAIYTFDGTVEQIVGFTDDLDVLEAGINTIEENVLERGNSTNLLGALILGLEQFSPSIDLSSVNYGYAVLMTDGVHNSDERTAESVIEEEVFFSEFDVRKDIYAVAVGDSVSIEDLTTLTGDRSKVYTVANLDNPDALENAFTEITNDVLAHTQGLYRIYYSSPKRSGEQEHEATIEVTGNTCVDSEECITSVGSTFSSANFTDVQPTLFALLNGGEEEDDRRRRLAGSDILVIQADLRWANATPSYTVSFASSLGTEPNSTTLATNRWSLQFPDGFTCAVIDIEDSSTNLNAKVKVSVDGDDILAESDRSLRDFETPTELDCP